MSNFPWLTVAGAIPLVGAVVIALTPGRSAPGSPADRRARDLLVKRIALVFTLATLAVTIAMAVQFKTGGPAVPVPAGLPVDPAVRRALRRRRRRHRAGADPDVRRPDAGRGAGLLERRRGRPAAAERPRRRADRRARPAATRSAKSYFALMLVLETMMIGVFAATDVFLFYVFFEAMLVPMYFMIGSFGVGQRQYAAVKFLLYSLLGGLLMLVAVIALYVYSTHGGHQGTFLFTLAEPPGAEPDRAEVAVPRLLHRLRDQGAAVAVPHLAAGRRHVRPARRGGAAGRRAGQGRHVRHDPVLPGPVPDGLALLHAAGHRAVGDRRPVRRDRRHRPGAT